MFGRKRKTDDFNAEIEAHLKLETERLQEQGLSFEEAREAAYRAFGNVTRAQERFYESGRWMWWDHFWQDVCYGMRMLRKFPGFTAVTILILALGIGANTAIFSLIDAVLFKALPVQNPSQLVMPNWSSYGWAESVVNNIECYCSDRDQSGRMESLAFSYPIYSQIRDRNRVFSSIAAMQGIGSQLNVDYKGRASRADGQLVSGSFFSTLGVRPVLGRVLTRDDDYTGGSQVAVISYGYWEKLFARDPDVVGQTIAINSVPFTIIGVSPPEFYGVQPGRAVEIWLPLHAPSQVGHGAGAFESRQDWWVIVIGRVKPGLSEQQTRTDLEGILQQTIASDVNRTTKPETIPHLNLETASKGLNELRREFSRPLFILMTVVGLVLMIACANVANLMLVRAKSRQKEIAIRLAVGAGRGRLVRQLLTESLLLAGLGGVVGLVMAFWSVNVLVAFIASGPEQVSLNVAPDLHVLGFTIALSLSTGILFGLSPALGSTRIDLTPALKESARDRAAGPDNGRGWWLGKGLVITQVSLSVVLLVGAGLFVRTLANIKNVSLGFNPRNLLLFGIDPTQDGYKGQRVVDFYQELARRIKALPGVRSVGLSESTLLGGDYSFLRTQVEGLRGNLGSSGEGAGAYYNWVGPQFFETMGIPLILGRAFSESDSPAQPTVAVVNQTFVRHFLGGGNAIGQRLDVGDRKGVEIIGIVGDSKDVGLILETQPTVYLAYLQYVGDLNPMHFEVRASSDPREVLGNARRIAHEMDAHLALSDVKTQTAQINQSVFQERLFARLTTFFGSLALLLACVGIYGMMAFTVGKRTHEIGIRMALGASRGQITLMILRETSILVGIGAIFGVAIALVASPLVSATLFGLKSDDPLTIAVSTLLMVGAAMLAGFIPARRAMRVDPIVALRYE